MLTGELGMLSPSLVAAAAVVVAVAEMTAVGAALDVVLLL